MRFGNLIKKYSTQIEVIKEAEGVFDGPKWIPGGKTNYLANLAVFYMTPKNIEFYEGGDYTTQDLKLLVPEPLTATNQTTGQEETINIEIGDKVVFNTIEYEVTEHQDRTIHADYHEYVAKKVVK